MKWNLSSISTGSIVFDSLLGGGLPISSITDVYGAFATGKTQFSFQNAIMTCERFLSSSNEKIGDKKKPLVAFVDCAGSFRPERIAEIASERGVNAGKALDLISCAYVRTISEQMKVSEQLLNEERFSKCRLVVIDDITTNFTAELNEAEEIIQRQFLLSTYLRKLSYIANRRGMSILLTNSIRSRVEQGEGETTGELISQFALFRLVFRREDRTRFAVVEQPIPSRGLKGVFEIQPKGLTP